MSSALQSPVSSADRLGFTIFMAVAIHAVAILGISFSLPDVSEIPQTLEVTLANFKSEEAPDDADFIAQNNQAGSGQLEEKQLPTTREKAEFQADDIQDVTSRLAVDNRQLTYDEMSAIETALAEIDGISQQQLSNSQHEVITSLAKQQQQAAPQSQTKQEQKKSSASLPGNTDTILTRSLEIASLEAQLALQQQAYAKRPRVKWMTSASTLSHKDAEYLSNWKRRIEAVGNLNYPVQARQQRLYGSLRLLVAIQPDGYVKDIQILHSSGSTLLDNAAMRIVELASPFQPFPEEMRQTTDILEIIRTWKFEKTTRVY
ncbi:energy transducer TonB [Aliamphritea spongicola]|uniref:energy transducer TonB n=1 Tax=Aliamphritea spongicola TaxID=707589 RepID=UPI00196A2C1A|nr:energy transducer TonB [Aliamphritea spongicola]MBN3564395.1 energy transducer TonB [Aliamphritea spongicola]